MKNKKLLAVFAIPLVIAVMVLPLCSFTTVMNSVGDHFESKSRVDIEYIYNRSNNNYYGVIPNFLSCSMTYSESLSSVRDSIKFTACNYVMDSNSQLEYKSFSSTRNPSILNSITTDNSYYGTYRADLALSMEIDTPSEATICAVNFKEYSGEDYSIEIFDNNYSSIYDNYYGVGIYSFGRVYYRESYEYSWKYFTYNVDIHASDIPVRDNKISVLDIWYYILAEYDIDERFDIYFPYLELEFRLYETSDVSSHSAYMFEELLNRIGGIRIDGEIYHYSSFTYPLGAHNDAYYYEQGYDVGYSEGYQIGSDYGVSNAESVWGSFTNFLTTTVGGFLDFHLTPNITISSILSVILSITLVVLFLKLFAGG